MSIHPTAIVSPKAEIDATVSIGPNCVVDEHVRIGPNCRLMHNVYVTGWTEIGNDCVLHPGAIVGHKPQDVKYNGERSYCRIGPNTIVREYVTIHRGTIPESETTVGRDCFLLAGCHVAHNCHVGDHVTIVNAALLAGHVTVGDRVMVGGSALFHQFVRVGQLAMIPGNANVSLDVPPFAMVDFDGRIIGLNKVGLRRAGVTPDETLELRQAFHNLFSRTGNSVEAAASLADIAKSDRVTQLVQFLQGESKRGIAGRSRRNKP